MSDDPLSDCRHVLATAVTGWTCIKCRAHFDSLGYDNADQVRRFALDEQSIHNPANQDGNVYGRCMHCHYVRHPCSAYELATVLLAVLDREAPDEYFT
jgi:hypothetical protein